MEQQQTAVFCQSCSMPMEHEGQFGTEAGGRKADEYCVYCYEEGAFKQPDMTMAEMAELCAGYMVQDGMEEAAARAILAGALPRLKRWSGAQS